MLSALVIISAWRVKFRFWPGMQIYLSMHTLIKQDKTLLWTYVAGAQFNVWTIIMQSLNIKEWNLFELQITHKVRKRAKIRNRYNQAPHLTQDTNGKVTTSQWDITNESQEVSPFSADDHKASKDRKNIMIHKRSTVLERSVSSLIWKLHNVSSPKVV